MTDNRFDKIKSIITKKKIKKTVINGKDNAQELVKNTASGKIKKRQAIKDYNNNVEDINIILKLEKITKEQEKNGKHFNC